MEILKNKMLRNALTLAVIAGVAYLLWYHFQEMKKKKALATAVEKVAGSGVTVVATTEPAPAPII